VADTLNDLADLALGIQDKVSELHEDAESFDKDFETIHNSISLLANRMDANSDAIAALTSLFRDFLTDITPLMEKAKRLEKMSPAAMVKDAMRRGRPE